eukprot:764529-Hanusia_phi.AAC.15
MDEMWQVVDQEPVKVSSASSFPGPFPSSSSSSPLARSRTPTCDVSQQVRAGPSVNATKLDTKSSMTVMRVIGQVDFDGGCGYHER